jgi:ribosomal protein S18 acetylase RimI-like enzyme
MYRHIWVAAGESAALGEVIDLVSIVSRDEPFVGCPSSPSDVDLKVLTGRLASGLRSGNTHVLTVRDAAGSVIACVAMTRPATANQRHIAELTTGAVHPAHRGQGVVTAAFGELVAQCERLGIDLLRLDVREGIKAEKVWRGYGFEVYGRLADYGRLGGMSYAGLYMAQPVAHLKATIGNRGHAHAQQG